MFGTASSHVLPSRLEMRLWRARARPVGHRRVSSAWLVAVRALRSWVGNRVLCGAYMTKWNLQLVSTVHNGGVGTRIHCSCSSEMLDPFQCARRTVHAEMPIDWVARVATCMRESGIARLGSALS
jgi:hypothetical protein